MKKTDRGFKIYSEFKDSYQNKITVQESSGAMEHCVWVFTKDHKGEQGFLHLGEIQAATPHLNKVQAKRLIKALTKFVEDK